MPTPPGIRLNGPATNRVSNYVAGGRAQLQRQPQQYFEVQNVTIPDQNQTVHLMDVFDIMRVRRRLRRENARSASDLELYSTDHLRDLYINSPNQQVQLRDEIVTRAEIVAEIHWRVWWGMFKNRVLLFLSLVAAIASVLAAVEGWRWRL